MRVFAAILSFLIFAATGEGHAHESRPLLVEIIERAPNTFVVTWKVPPSALDVTSPGVVMPQECRASAPASGTRLVRRQLFRCSGDLSGREISIGFPGYNPSISTMFQIRRLSGEKHTAIRSPEAPRWRIPERETTTGVALEYLQLGVEHILKGYDHLLFVACLIFIAGTWRRILVTITGFTIAHSLTLALAALDIVRIPVPPVEAVIALSIVLLATEIARRQHDTLTWRYPIAVSMSFGLLHGFGFASVLNEIGLPQTEIVAALLFFNLGVEVGQIVFVLATMAFVLLPVLAGVSKMVATDRDGIMPRAMSLPVAYIVGSLSAYWTIERVAGFAT
jgi:hydrogenase/urease accessory protein HupE